MPRNRLIYVGVLVVAASALLYIGGQIIRTIEWFLPWAAGAGVALILLGLFVEMRKSGKPTPIASGTAATEQQSPTTAQTQDKL
jgi:membrane-bound ClpP family serine protease